MIEIYTQPNCAPCRGTENWLKAHDVEFVAYNIQEDEKALARIEQLGYNSTPVIKVGDSHFGGFDISKLKALV